MRRLLAAILLTCLGGGALGQSTGVPDPLLHETRREQADSIRVCQDAGSPIRDFDREVARAIGDALFLKIGFEEGFHGFPISGDGFLQELQIAMTNRCDLMMGMSVQEESPFPDWVAMTRPYAAFDYVLAVADPGWTALRDIPTDRVIGTQLGSLGELVFITWNQQRPAGERYKRLPYADHALMVRRVLDGHLGGMLVWRPIMADLLKANPDAAKLRLIDVAPMPPTVTRVGALVSSKDSFLRTQIDGAIDALTGDGTIAGIMAKYGYADAP